MSLLTSHLLVTGGQGHIQLIDLERGEILRTVSVGSSDKSAFVNQIHVVQNSVIVCDYARISTPPPHTFLSPFSRTGGT